MADLTRNPIIWQEVNYQQRSTPRLTPHWHLIGPLLLGVCIIVLLLTLTRIDYPTRDIGLCVIWIVHAATVVRAISVGGNTISREHVGMTWDALVLTGVSARQILLGKWSAALQRIGPWMLALGLLRLAMLPIFMLAMVNRLAWRNILYGSYYDWTIAWIPAAAIFAVFATVVMTILEVLASTALGLASSAVTRRGGIALVTALTIRFLPVALFAALTRYELGPIPAYRAVRYAPFAIADSGTSPLSILALPRLPGNTTLGFDAVYGLFLAGVVLIILLFTSILIAWIAIRRSGALPHPRHNAIT